MIQIGIYGGAGYTAGELLRVLLNHPLAEVALIHSTSNAGNKVYDVHRDLIGEYDLTFQSEISFNNLDVIFLCMGHGKSKSFVQENEIPSSVRIIDLSNDYRLKADADDFVYGLPELNRTLIKTSKHIANPGCFATGIQLSLLPLAQAGLISDEIHVNAITGATGAGQNPTRTSHFAWRNDNVSIYKVFTHQHLGEINQSLQQLQNEYSPALNFIPVRGNHTRGIYVSMYTKYSGTLDEAKSMYKAYYAEHPFVHLTDENPDLKQVVNTNKCILHLEKHDDKLLVLSITDNLIKGASGQAVHNMNLMFGLDETTGLKLKPVGF